MECRAIVKISLRVRSIAESAEFYRDYFGLELDEDQSRPKRRIFHTNGCGEGEESDPGFHIVLNQGLPPGGVPRMDHFSIEVQSKEDIFSIHERASSDSLQATRPRVLNGRWQLFIFDPDGYKIEVVAANEASEQESQAGD